MKRIRTRVLISAIVLSIAAGVVFAASIHLKNPPPTATYDNNALVLTVSGALSGLGNGNVTIEVTATVTPTVICSNKGENKPPGQNPGQITLTGVVTIPQGQIKNGNVSFTVKTSPPDQPTAAEAGCPGGNGDNWTAQITCLAFNGYTITVKQGTTTAVFNEPFTSSCP